MAIPSAQRGQGVRKTNCPLWNRLSGYLKRISNMESTFYGNIAINIWTWPVPPSVTETPELVGSSTSDGISAKPSYVRQDSTGREWRDSQTMGCESPRSLP